MLNRCAKVVRGGRRFSYAAVMVVGDGQGHVGIGMGKARETPEAIRKGIEQAKKNLFEVPLKGRTIPHTGARALRRRRRPAQARRARHRGHRRRRRARRGRGRRDLGRPLQVPGVGQQGQRGQGHRDGPQGPHHPGRRHAQARSPAHRTAPRAQAPDSSAAAPGRASAALHGAGTRPARKPAPRRRPAATSRARRGPRPADAGPQRASKQAMPETLRIKYKKSAIGYSQRQKDTIRSLGFKRLGQTVEIPDNPAMRGMVRHVQHLVVDPRGRGRRRPRAGARTSPGGPETGAPGR